MSYNINMTTTGDPAISRLAAVSVKIPDFLPQHPSLWIRQAEAQFVLANVSQDSTKYYHLVSRLPADVLIQLADIIDIEEYTSGLYERLKMQLKERFAPSGHTISY